MMFAPRYTCPDSVARPTYHPYGAGTLSLETLARYRGARAGGEIRSLSDIRSLRTSGQLNTTDELIVTY